jgi:dTDP-4-dehydrorhamnose reductase
MKHILVTGGNGQLGSSLRQKAGRPGNFRFTFVDMADLDLTDAARTRQYLLDACPDYIINCAAYTAVDKAESDPDTCFAVNAGIPALLASLAIEVPFRLLHLSTDYIYNGNLPLPHTEDETPAPDSVYGKSKLAGDQSLAGNKNAMIIRTSWLYSEFGNNFLSTMIRLGNEKKEIGVVFDQTGTPTYAGDLAFAMLDIISFSEKQGFVSGIFNYANEGVCSWYDFATEIMQLTGKPCKVLPIRTADYPLPAPRPVFSVMDKSAIRKTFQLTIPYWKDSLRTVIDNLQKKEEI